MRHYLPIPDPLPAVSGLLIEQQLSQGSDSFSLRLLMPCKPVDGAHLPTLFASKSSSVMCKQAWRIFTLLGEVWDCQIEFLSVDIGPMAPVIMLCWDGSVPKESKTPSTSSNVALSSHQVRQATGFIQIELVLASRCNFIIFTWAKSQSWAGPRC